MKILINTNRFGVKEVLFDDEDYDLIKDYVWHIQYDKGNFYARCNVLVNGKKKSPKMHRIIMGVAHKERPHVDHKNENGLDNRRSNLRLATIPQNARNTGANSRNVSGYKGVSLYTVGPQAGKYVVRLRYNGKNYFGGYFDTAEDAAIKYNEMALKYHKEFAYQNKIGSTKQEDVGNHKIGDALKRYKKSKTGYYGVTTTHVSHKKRFIAVIRINNKGKSIGYFDTAIEAAKAYDKKAKELYGENAILNFKT